MQIDDDCVIELPYDQDCLYVRAEGASYCLAPWRADMACSRYVDRRWQPAPDQPDWRFGEYRPRAERSSPVARFLAPIPQELRRLAGRFAWGQIPALRLLRLTPYAAQLAASEPFLFWLLAMAFQEQRFAARECRALFLLPRKKVLAELMGEDPGGKGLSINTVRKLSLKRYDHSEYLMFMTLYRSGLFKTARHAPSICFETLLYRFSTPDISLIANLLGKMPFHLWYEARYLYFECMRLTLNNDQTREAANNAAMACRDLYDLRSLHDSLTAPFKKPFFLEPEEHPPFPAPPFAGSATIEPITTPQELYEEGIAMEHCVYSLAHEASEGSVYVYRVLAPERGTLSLRIIDGQPQLEEFSLRRNAEPSEESQACVHIWFSRAIAAKNSVTFEKERLCNTRSCA